MFPVPLALIGDRTAPAALPTAVARDPVLVLIVDARPATLPALQQHLQPLTKRWHLRYAASGAEALAALEATHYTAIITDPHLPDMEGGQLLSQVQSRHPEVLRYVWTPDNRQFHTLQALTSAHQVFNKVSALDVLESLIEKGHALQQRLRSPAVLRTMAKLKSLPALPQSYSRLSQALDNPATSSAVIAGIIEQDVSMTARLLQLANSSFFPGARRVSCIKDAVTKIGMLPLRAVVLGLELFRASEKELPAGFSLAALQQHSLQVGQQAAALLDSYDDKQTAFTAGMLHDIGILIFASGLPTVWPVIRERAAQANTPLHEAETEAFGCSHAEIGGRLLALWGLPNSVVEAVTYHHRPCASGQTHFGVLAAVHFANALAHQPPHPDSAPDESFLMRIGGFKALKPTLQSALRAAA